MGKKALIITSSGGGGHLQAAKAKAHELHEKFPDMPVIQRDILLDWMGKLFGHFSSGLWNLAQKRGDVLVQKTLARSIPNFNRLSWLPVFLSAFFLIYRQDIDLIIDTQPNSTSAILSAIMLANKFKQLDRRYEKVLVDLPTDRAGHYFDAIKKLKPQRRNLIHLYTTKPLLADGQTEEEFWDIHTGLPVANIIYAGFPLRPAFKKIDSPLPRHEPLTLAPRIPSVHEWSLIKPILDQAGTDYDYCAPYLDITIPADAAVTTLMLGSQPAQKATLRYIDHFIRLKHDHPNRHDYLFVFCHRARKRSCLLRQACDLIATTPDFPDNLSIVPLTFQDDTIIAPLFARSDASLTRSGGVTSMELLSIMNGTIWIHSEANQNQPPIKGISFWEKGNARYLQAIKGAHIITPDIFPTVAQPYFSQEALRQHV